MKPDVTVSIIYARVSSSQDAGEGFWTCMHCDSNDCEAAMGLSSN